MRYPLITPLASRDGSVNKDEHLVNAYAEQDDETKETFVFKRAGLDEGEAVLTGNDIYGQGLFNYDGYWYSIIGDILWWYDTSGTQQGSIGFGAIVIWDNEDTYDIGDAVVYDGEVYYSYAPNNVGNNPNTSPFWGTTAPTSDRYRTGLGGFDGEDCATSIAAGYSAYNAYPYKDCGSAGGGIYPYSEWRILVNVTSSGGAYGYGYLRTEQWVDLKGTPCATGFLSGITDSDIQKVA